MKKVAVIGSGAAGLVACRELVRFGHLPTVFESGDRVGGVWCYKPDAAEDPLYGARSSMYPSLRTNLPRSLMAFLDYPFDSAGGGRDDMPLYPSHTDVLSYLEKFAQDFNVMPFVRFQHPVERVHKDESGGWLVRSNGQEEPFDAVMVCNGHYQIPRVVPIPGLDSFPGFAMHSHNYRTPERFTDAVVAILGASNSGKDLRREVAPVAKHVYFCGAQHVAYEEGNVSVRPWVESITSEGELVFSDGSKSERIDQIIFATGYRYNFPFLDEKLVRVDDNRVTPLWKHLLCIDEPTLCFVGIPIRIIPFPIFEMQSRFFCKWLNGEVTLPSTAAMREEEEREYHEFLKQGGKPRNAHFLGPRQTDYFNDLAARAGEPELPHWYAELKEKHYANMVGFPDEFRDMNLPQLGPTKVP